MSVTNFIREHISQDIFDQQARDRAKAVYTAMFERRGYLNQQKAKLLASHRNYKNTPAYRVRLDAVKEAVTMLTKLINQVNDMCEKNQVSTDSLDEIEHTYKGQVF